MLAERVMDTIAATQEVPRDRITLESSFEELGFDSLDGFNLLYAVEEELDVTIPDDVARELRSVGDVVEAVERLLTGETGETHETGTPEETPGKAPSPDGDAVAASPPGDPAAPAGSGSSGSTGR